MAQAQEKADGPFEEFASSVLKFSPKGLWRTCLVVWRAGKPGEESLALAIANQDRTVVLSPFQYIAGTAAVSVIVIWLLNGLSQGKLDKPETISFLDPEFLPMLLWPLGLAIPLHFMLGAGRRPDSLVHGVWDGVWKTYQLFMYMLGHFFLFVLAVMLGIAAGDAIAWNGGRPVPDDFRTTVGFLVTIGIAFAGACFTFYPMIFRTMPATLGRLYGVSRGWALASTFILAMAAVMAESLITTGKLPE